MAEAWRFHMLFDPVFLLSLNFFLMKKMHMLNTPSKKVSHLKMTFKWNIIYKYEMIKQRLSIHIKLQMLLTHEVTFWDKSLVSWKWYKAKWSMSYQLRCLIIQFTTEYIIYFHSYVLHCKLWFTATDTRVKHCMFITQEMTKI